MRARAPPRAGRSPPDRALTRARALSFCAPSPPHSERRKQEKLAAARKEMNRSIEQQRAIAQRRREEERAADQAQVGAQRQARRVAQLPS